MEENNIKETRGYAAPEGVVSPSSVQWFPMRVTYGRGAQVKRFLDSKSIENFLPMRRQTVYDGKQVSLHEEPAIDNLIFVHSTMDTITALKRGHEEAEPLRYMTYHPMANPAETKVITVPDRQMDNFIRACNGPADGFTFLTPDEMLGKAHCRVEIISGPFRGVQGVIKRVHGNRHIVVELDGLCGVQLKMVSKTQMKGMNPNSNEKNKMRKWKKSN